MLLLLTWHHHLFGQLLVLPMYFFKLAISLLKIFTTRPHLQQKFYISTWGPRLILVPGLLMKCSLVFVAIY